MADYGRPCKLRLQIEDGAIREMEDMGFHLMDSPDVIVPGQREYETEDYPEYDGVKIYPYTSYKSFDYTCKMLFVGDLESMNEKIRDLWEMMFEQQASGVVRKAKSVTLINDFKAVSVTGYAKEMPGEETFVEVRKGCWKFDFTIFVADPSKCVWSLDAEYRNLLKDTKLFSTLGQYPIYDDGENVAFGVWLGEFGTVTASTTRPGFNQAKFDTNNSEGQAVSYQLLESVSEGWHTLSARIKSEGTAGDTICIIFVSSMQFESEDDIKIYLDGVEQQLTGGYGIVGFYAPGDSAWHNLVANIKIPYDMPEEEMFAIVIGGVNPPQIITTEVIQFERGLIATPWTKNKEEN